jgi:tRNA pseudouridine38-40 synthase
LDEKARNSDSKEFTMRTLKLVLAYDGTDFSGWQVQPHAATIQGTLASAIPADNLVKALNNVLPPSIRVLEASEVQPDFHARKSARAKTYRYRIYRGAICPPVLARYVWHYPYPLDGTAMSAAAAEVAGEHDFTSFAAVDAELGQDRREFSNIRQVFSSVWERQADEFVYTIRGNGFLPHMVRNLVGTFILVGKGTLKPDEMKRILNARDRSAAGATAPACGLFLAGVEY